MADEPIIFRAACVQMRSGLSRAANTDAALALIREAADGGATFAATPEVTNIADVKPNRLFADLPDEAGLEEIGRFADAARSNELWLLIGSMAVRVGERKAANRSYLFAPDGRIAATYDKLHMFDVSLPKGETWRESNVFEPGDRAICVDTPLAKFGLTICYDLRFPHLYRALAQAGAEVLCVPAAFTRQTGEAHWKTLLRARAIECGAFVLAPAQGGKHEDGRETYGHSLMIGPWGDILAEADNDAPGVIFADIEPEKAAEARRRIPNLALERNHEVLIVKA